MLKRLLDGYIFLTRWLLLPFIFMLGIGLIGLMLKAARNTLHFIQVIYSANDEYIKIELLELVDLTLIAALIAVVTISVYGTFIFKIDSVDADGKPAWMATVDFNQLKLKLLTTLVVISAVRLLEVFMEVERFDERDLYFFIALHLTLLASRVTMAFSPKNYDQE